MLLSLIIIGALITIPNIIKIVNINIPYLNDIVNAEIYPDILNYSKFLISVGIIFLILSLAFRKLLNRLSDYIRTYINTRENIYAEVSQKNDMEMKIKQEKAKNTKVIFCPHCGADNILTETVGTCKFCRRNLNGN